MSIKTKTIVVTGGHVTPAIAVIDEILKKQPETNIIFIGRQYTSSYEKKESFEYQVVTKRKIPFYFLKTGRLQRHSFLGAVLGIFVAIRGIWMSLLLLRSHRPDSIFTCGGYIGFAVSIAAWMLRIPVFMHEQTIAPGIANKIIARFAKKVFISFVSTADKFPQDITLWIGNPIRGGLFQHTDKHGFEIDKRFPIIFITGGSLGAHSINKLIYTIAEELLRDFTLVIQTGNLQETGDYEAFVSLQKSLDVDLASRLYVLTHVDENQLAFLLQNASLVVSRSGANTITELVAFSLPAILIPLPWAAYNEQRLHALWYAKQGRGVMFEQTGTAKQLLDLIHNVSKNRSKYRGHINKTDETPYNPQAAAYIARELVE